jgi:hypothetical protein
MFVAKFYRDGEENKKGGIVLFLFLFLFNSEVGASRYNNYAGGQRSTNTKPYRAQSYIGCAVTT